MFLYWCDEIEGAGGGTTHLTVFFLMVRWIERTSRVIFFFLFWAGRNDRNKKVYPSGSTPSFSLFFLVYMWPDCWGRIVFLLFSTSPDIFRVFISRRPNLSASDIIAPLETKKKKEISLFLCVTVLWRRDTKWSRSNWLCYQANWCQLSLSRLQRRPEHQSGELFFFF